MNDIDKRNDHVQTENQIPIRNFSHIGKWGTIIGFVLLILGIIAILLPTLAAVVIETWLGVLLVIVGVTLFFQVFQNRGHGSVVYEVIGGLIYLAGGLILLFMPMSGVITIALVLAVVFIIDGVSRIAFATRAFSAQRRWLWIFDGIISLLLGGLILANWPGDSAWVIGILVGIKLVINGIVTIFVSNSIKKA